MALNLLAAATRPTGNTRQERALLEESIALFRASEDRWGCGYSLNDLGMVAHLQGDDEEAARLSLESLTIFDQLGDLRGRAFALDSLGVIATGRGDLEDAASKHAESVALRQSLGDEWGSAIALVHRAEVARKMGRYRQARGWLLDALRTALAGGLQPIIINAFIELAMLSIARDQPVLARDALILVLRHPASAWHTRDNAMRMLSALGKDERQQVKMSVALNEEEADELLQHVAQRFMEEDVVTSTRAS